MSCGWGDSFRWQYVCCARKRTWVGALAHMGKNPEPCACNPSTMNETGGSMGLSWLAVYKISSMRDLTSKSKMAKVLWNISGIDL